MAKKKRSRRSRSPHPGVVLKKRTWSSGAVTWFARYTDPDSGKKRDENLTKLGLKNHAARVDHARRLSLRLAERTRALRLGAAKHTNTPLAEAFDAYLETVQNPSTRETYARGVMRFLTWAEELGLHTTDELHPHHLAQFRAWLRALPRRVVVQGGRRGKKKADSTPAKATSTNSYLRSVKAALNALRRLGRLPHIDAEAIKDRLATFPTDEDPPHFLRSPELRKLLKASLRHDLACYAETREEHAGLRRKGTTPRYIPITPFLLGALLGGLRAGELYRLSWDMVHLNAKDEHEARVGELRLPSYGTKTRRARTVDLGISPGLRRVLVALRLKSGGSGFVFGGDNPWDRALVDAARKRLMREFHAPSFTWQDLRATCETFHVNMPGLGSSAPWQAALRMGHSVTIAQRFYVGLLRGVPRGASTLEAAMGVDELVEQAASVCTGVTELRPGTRAASPA